MEKAAKNNVKVHLPVDFITADKFDENAQVSNKSYILNILCISKLYVNWLMTPYEHHRRDTGATGAHSRILSLLVGEGRQRSARAVPSRCPLFTVRFTDVEQYKKVVYKRDTKEFLPKAMVFLLHLCYCSYLLMLWFLFHSVLPQKVKLDTYDCNYVQQHDRWQICRSLEATVGHRGA